MGLMDFLSPALTTATQAAGAYQGAEGNAAITRRESQMQALMTLRQQRQLESQLALQQAQTGEAQSKATLNTREANTPRLGDAGYAQMMGDVEAQKALATLPVQTQLEVLRGNISLHNAIAQAGVEHGYKTQEIGTEYGLKGQLQSNEQGFQEGQLQRQLAGQRQNQSASISQTQSGQVIPSIVHGAKYAGHTFVDALTPHPSASSPQMADVNGSASAPATPQQASYDRAAAALKASGADPVTILGQRP